MYIHIYICIYIYIYTYIYTYTCTYRVNSSLCLFQAQTPISDGPNSEPPPRHSANSAS